MPEMASWSWLKKKMTQSPGTARYWRPRAGNGLQKLVGNVTDTEATFHTLYVHDESMTTVTAMQLKTWPAPTAFHTLEIICSSVFIREANRIGSSHSATFTQVQMQLKPQNSHQLNHSRVSYMQHVFNNCLFLEDRVVLSVTIRCVNTGILL